MKFSILAGIAIFLTQVTTAGASPKSIAPAMMSACQIEAFLAGSGGTAGERYLIVLHATLRGLSTEALKTIRESAKPVNPITYELDNLDRENRLAYSRAFDYAVALFDENDRDEWQKVQDEIDVILASRGETAVRRETAHTETEKLFVTLPLENLQLFTSTTKPLVPDGRGDLYSIRDRSDKEHEIIRIRGGKIDVVDKLPDLRYSPIKLYSAGIVAASDGRVFCPLQRSDGSLEVYEITPQGLKVPALKLKKMKNDDVDSFDVRIDNKPGDTKVLMATNAGIYVFNVDRRETGFIGSEKEMSGSRPHMLGIYDGRVANYLRDGILATVERKAKGKYSLKKIPTKVDLEEEPYFWDWAMTERWLTLHRNAEGHPILAGMKNMEDSDFGAFAVLDLATGKRFEQPTKVGVKLTPMSRFTVDEEFTRFVTKDGRLFFSFYGSDPLLSFGARVFDVEKQVIESFAFPDAFISSRKFFQARDGRIFLVVLGGRLNPAAAVPITPANAAAALSLITPGAPSAGPKATSNGAAKRFIALIDLNTNEIHEVNFPGNPDEIESIWAVNETADGRVNVYTARTFPEKGAIRGFQVYGPVKKTSRGPSSVSDPAPTGIPLVCRILDLMAGSQGTAAESYLRVLRATTVERRGFTNEGLRLVLESQNPANPIREGWDILDEENRHAFSIAYDYAVDLFGDDDEGREQWRQVQSEVARMLEDRDERAVHREEAHEKTNKIFVTLPLKPLNLIDGKTESFKDDGRGNLYAVKKITDSESEVIRVRGGAVDVIGTLPPLYHSKFSGSTASVQITADGRVFVGVYDAKKNLDVLEVTSQGLRSLGLGRRLLKGDTSDVFNVKIDNQPGDTKILFSDSFGIYVFNVDRGESAAIAFHKKYDGTNPMLIDTFDGRVANFHLMDATFSFLERIRKGDYVLKTMRTKVNLDGDYLWEWAIRENWLTLHKNAAGNPVLAGMKNMKEGDSGAFAVRDLVTNQKFEHPTRVGVLLTPMGGYSVDDSFTRFVAKDGRLYFSFVGSDDLGHPGVRVLDVEKQRILSFPFGENQMFIWSRQFYQLRDGRLFLIVTGAVPKSGTGRVGPDGRFIKLFDVDGEIMLDLKFPGTESDKIVAISETEDQKLNIYVTRIFPSDGAIRGFQVYGPMGMGDKKERRRP